MNKNQKPPFTFLIIVTCIAIFIPLFIFVMVTQLVKGDFNPDRENGSSVAFHLGTIPVAWYGIMIFIGFAIAILLSCLKM
jgi:hypothetical protein